MQQVAKKQGSFNPNMRELKGSGNLRVPRDVFIDRITEALSPKSIKMNK
jgi:hypothetical protein